MSPGQKEECGFAVLCLEHVLGLKVAKLLLQEDLLVSVCHIDQAAARL